MGQNIKREIIDNIVVTMSIYISDQDKLAILDSVISSELTKVNLQEICSLPAEWKTDAEQRNAYLIELFKIKKRALKKATEDFVPKTELWNTLVMPGLRSRSERGTVCRHWRGNNRG